MLALLDRSPYFQYLCCMLQLWPRQLQLYVRVDLHQCSVRSIRGVLGRSCCMQVMKESTI